MGGFSLNVSGVIVLIAVIFVIVGLVLSLSYLFKRRENLTEEDEVHYKRAILLWVGSAAIALVGIYTAKREKGYDILNLGSAKTMMSGSARSASLL
jgi:archaellum component FlaF (FlaF/FlaG flagellin family)